MRDRAIDLLAEEDDLGQGAGVDVGARPRQAVPPPARRARPPARRPATRRLDDRLGAGVARTRRSSQASGWGPVVGDGAGLVARLTQLLADGYRVVVAADGEGSAERLAALLRDHGLDLPVHRGTAPATSPRPAATSSSPRCTTASRCRRPSWRSSPRATSPAAAAPTAGRGRAGATAPAFFEDLKPGNYVVHVQHGVGRYEGMVKRTIGGVERDYLLVAYKGDDKLYVPSDQIDVLRQYVGGEAPTLHRLGGSDFAKAKSRVRSAVREIAQELVVLYQKRVNAEGYAFGQDTPWQAEMEDAFPYVETPDQRVAIADVKADMERPYPMDRLRVRRRRLRQDRGRHPRRVQGDPGRQAGRRARPDDAARHASTATRSPTASPATRSASRR